MNSCRLGILIAAAVSFQAQSLGAQDSGDRATVSGKMYPPTAAECIDALNSGHVLGTTPDGRIIVAKSNTIYWVTISSAILDCQASRFPRKGE